MLKIAIVHDGLMCKGGAEQVTLAFHKAFPNAPIYTLAYDRSQAFPEFQNANVRTSWMQFISNKDEVVKRLFFPLGILAMKMVDISDYEIVLMSTTHCAKYVKVGANTKVFCYAHNPFRLAWYPNEYDQYNKAKGILKLLFNRVIKILRLIDKSSVSKINYFITNSSLVKERLQYIYNLTEPITILPPPVNVDNFYITTVRKEYFLVVSRLEYYKRVDLVVDVFNELNLPLVIVGKGSEKQKLQQSAKGNIIFKENLAKDKLSEIYSGARAFIFPQLEDYGITPLEANASGLPVIAYGKGGVLDTQLNFLEYKERATALFFGEQTKESLLNAINLFMEIENNFCGERIREHALKFSEDKFIKSITDFINEKV